MTVTASPRFGAPVWGAGTDPFNRSQMNQLVTQLEALGAQSVIGTSASRPAAGKSKVFHYATNTGALSFDTGSAWVALPTLGVSNTFSVPQRIAADETTDAVLNIDNGSTASATSVRLRRRTASDFSTFNRFDLRATATRIAILGHSSAGITAGYGSDLSGIDGRWALNWNQDVAPTDLLIIRDRSGNERARFTEAGYLGIGQASPIRTLDVSGPANGPLARFGSSSGLFAFTINPTSDRSVVLLSGADQNAGVATARAVAASGIELVSGGGVRFYGNSGLTAGNTFTKNVTLAVDALGSLFTPGQNLIGPGSIGSGAILLQSAGVVGTNISQLHASMSAGTTSVLDLVSDTAQGQIRLFPANDSRLGAISYITADTGETVFAAGNWLATGGGAGVAAQTEPAFRVILVRATARADQNLVEFFTGIGSLQTRALMISALGIRGGGVENSGSWGSLPVTYINDSQVNCSGVQLGSPCRLAIVLMK